MVLKKRVLSLVSAELELFDQHMISKLEADLPFIQVFSQHIMESGGKRLRPLLVMLGCKLFNQDRDQSIHLAIAIEYFHTATLLHDDVVDEALLRRGKRSAHLIWGSKASVLVGDFLFTRAFQLLVDAKHPGIIQLLSDTSNAMTRGEILQLIHLDKPSFDKEHYQTIIRGKTASLFSAAAQMGALLAGASDATVQSMAAYGLHLGQAFQLIDDALDYTGTAEQIGKDARYDLTSGKVTLPMIHAYHQGSFEQKALIRQAMETKDLDLILEVKAIIDQTCAVEYTYALAQEEMNKAKLALAEFPESKVRLALFDLADFAVSRAF